MVERTLPGLGLTGFWPLGADGWKDAMDANLRLLSAAAQLSVISRTTALPGSPTDGNIYIVPDAAPEFGGQIAIRDAGAWVYVPPKNGMRVWIQDEENLRVYDGSLWVIPNTAEFQNLPGVGINADYDANNKLSVAAAATLLNHDGAGHQLKINKAAVGDTASLLFQSDWSGRAEMGLSGNDDFSVKVSPNGSAWETGLIIDKDTGEVALPKNMLSLVPTVSASTPGDISVTYSTQVLEVVTFGSIVLFSLRVSFIPTFTTASGQFRIFGFPFSFTGGSGSVVFGGSASKPSYPAGCTALGVNCGAGNNFILLTGMGSEVGTALSIANFVSGENYIISISGVATR